MAVRKLDEARQPLLESLNMPEPTFKTLGFAMPAVEEIDLAQVRFYLDLDLDELTTHFGDIHTPYDMEDVSPYGQVLVNGDSNEVVGVNITHFLTAALRRRPDLATVLKFATVITGDHIVANPITGAELPETQAKMPTEELLRRDLKSAIAASMQALMAG